MSYEPISEDILFQVPAKPEPKSAVAIRENLSSVETTLSEFDKVSAGLADLAARFPHDLVYPVETTKGMQEAIAHRAAWREPRITVEKLRKMAKAPVLALGKDIDARAAWLTEQLLEGESPVDEQIKAEERRKEEVKQARINAEFERVAKIQEAIADISMDATIASGKPSTNIRSALHNVRTQVLDPLVFQEMMLQAEAAKASAVAKLEVALSAALHHEAEADKVAAERAELEVLRKAAAEQKAKDAIAAEAKAAEERVKEAEAIKAAKAEQARLDAEAAAKRAEEDRIAAEARKVAQAEHEAKMKAEREAATEARRLADEKAAKALAKQRKAEAADKQARDAAQTMIAALREVRQYVTADAGLQIIDAALREATGESAA